MKVADNGLAVDALLPGFARIDKASPGFALMVDGGKTAVSALPGGADKQPGLACETLPIPAPVGNVRAGAPMLPERQTPLEIAPSLPAPMPATAEPRARRSMLPELLTGASLIQTSATSGKAVATVPLPAGIDAKPDMADPAIDGDVAQADIIAATPKLPISAPEAAPAVAAARQSIADAPAAPVATESPVVSAPSATPAAPASPAPSRIAPQGQTKAAEGLAPPQPAVPDAPTIAAGDAARPGSPEKAQTPAPLTGRAPKDDVARDTVTVAEIAATPVAPPLATVAPQPDIANTSPNPGDAKTPGQIRVATAAPGNGHPVAAAQDGKDDAPLTAFQPDTGTDARDGSEDNAAGRKPTPPDPAMTSERAATPQPPLPEPRAANATPQPDRVPAPAAPVAAHAAPAAATPSPALAPAPAPRHEIEIDARSGSVGRDLGIAIAHRAKNGEDMVRVRMTPGELGRVEVTLAFDDKGNVQATLKADNHHALDLLRRDAVELTRALDQAGIRADTQSFRFESRSDGSQQQMMNQQGNGGNGGQPRPGAAPIPADDGDFGDSESGYRPVRSDGRVDLIA
ncbi:flagellar hook-length control protein FliK [Sphingosinithalassobacter portus]|uniref:flagellar hook-length control protein FliK n=1 Tax=Stakelama portus TaxID=2676234 RepID=UPI000D6E06E8|nr:flagellar hook-length control protein FliK [Sphingosinithalassobacter portus]